MFAYLSFISADSLLERGGEEKILGSREARGERGNNGRGGATFSPSLFAFALSPRARPKSSLSVPFLALVTQSTLLKVDDDDDDFCDDGDDDDDNDLSSLISIT